MWRTTRCQMQIYFIKICCHNEWRGRRRVLLVLNSKRAPPLFSEMGVFKNSKGSLYTMNVLIIKLLLCLGWLSSVALGQLELSEAVTGFVNFPEVGISCIGNLAVFITSVSKGRLDLEMGARDVLATVRGPKLYDINNRVGFTTYGAVFIGANKLPQTVRHTYGANNGAVFIAYEGSAGKWYDIHSMPPSIPRVAVIIVAIGIALGMDCLHLYLYRTERAENASEKPRKVPPIMCIASGSIAAGVLGIKPFTK